MSTGTNGACIEKCGDGINDGLFACDDGNLINGDGCSNLCTIEKDYKCKGGFIGKSDSCTYVPTEIVSVITYTFTNILI